MTMTAVQPDLFAPAVEEVPRPGSRAARLRQPRAVDVVQSIAAETGVCVRPVTLRRTDLDSGATQVIDLPCGATLESKCPACARKAARLRRQQIREGWHRDDEPLPGPDPASDDQEGLIITRAHLEFDRAALMLADLKAEKRSGQVAEVDEAIEEVERLLSAEGLRGRAAPSHLDEAGEETPEVRPKRSTKRREDVPDLPRRKVEDRTTGRTYGTQGGPVFRPSMFVTLTLDSYGKVFDDGTPVNSSTYDYRRAAWDAVHFASLLDRFWQNLRRAVGWNVQYAGSVEPQRRLAPHAHFAIRGTIPREMLRQVTAATYHQVWWPSTDRVLSAEDVRWDATAGLYLGPDGTPLPTWKDAIARLDEDDDADPVHVVRFGRQMHAEGVLAGSKDSHRCLGYITKYLTKQAADCHTVTSDRQRAHLDRLWEELRFTPCSERCANWLLCGVQPKNAREGMRPGNCRAKVHKRETLGLGGRRVLISRQWSGKTLADHRADNHAWVKQLLGTTVGHEEDSDGSPSRFAWEMARRDDPDVYPLDHRLLLSISARLRFRAAIEQATRDGPPNVSATQTDSSTPGEE